MPIGSAATVAVQLAVTGAAQVQQATGQAGSSFGRLEKTLGKLQGPANIAGAGVLAFAVSAGNAASDVEQAYGGLDSVFGKNSDAVKKWSEDAATNVGLAADDYATAASKMGAQFKNMGLAQDKTMAGTENMISLGADLSATFGGSTQEAVDALSAAFRGEADSAERYGLNLSAATVQAELAARGQDKLTGKALSAARAQAIMDLATKQAGGSIGQFARESDTAAGQQQRATAQWKNASAALGKTLLPLMAFLAMIVARVSQYMQQNQGVVKTTAVVLLGLAVAVKAVSLGIKVYNAAMAIAAARTKLVNAVMKMNPAVRIAIIIGALVAAVVLLYRKSETFRNIVNAVWTSVQAVIVGVFRVITGIWRGITKFFSGLFSGVRSVASGVWSGISRVITAVVDVVKRVWAVITGFFSGLFDGVKSVASGVWSAISAVITAVVDVVKSVWNGITGFFSGLWDGIKSAASTVWDGIKAVVNGVFDGIKAVWEGITGFFSGLWDGIKSAASTVWEGIKGVVNNVVQPIKDAWDGISGFFSGLFGGVADVVGGIIDGILTAVQGVKDAVRELTTGFLPSQADLAKTFNLNPSGVGGSGGLGGSAPSLIAAAGDLNYSGPRSSSRGYSVAPVIIVQALDPAAAGRSVRTVLRADARSRGPIAIGGLS